MAKKKPLRRNKTWICFINLAQNVKKTFKKKKKKEKNVCQPVCLSDVRPSTAFLITDACHTDCNQTLWKPYFSEERGLKFFQYYFYFIFFAPIGQVDSGSGRGGVSINRYRVLFSNLVMVRDIEQKESRPCEQKFRAAHFRYTNLYSN